MSYKYKSIIIAHGSCYDADVPTLESALNDGWVIDVISPSHTNATANWLVILKKLITDNVDINELKQKS